MGLKKAWKKYSRPVLGVLTSGLSEFYYKKREGDEAKKGIKKQKKLFASFNDFSGGDEREHGTYHAGEGVSPF